MARNGQKPKESGVDAGFSPMHTGTIRLSRKLGRRSIGQVVRARDDILYTIDDYVRSVELRSPNCYALTIMGSHFVRQQVEDNSELDSYQLAHDMHTKLPRTIHRPLRDVATDRVVLLGRGRAKTLAIKLNSVVLHKERDVAKTLLCRHIGCTGLRSEMAFIPHISVARVTLYDNLSDFEPSFLPDGVFLDRLEIT